jgi:hypothetical protein
MKNMIDSMLDWCEVDVLQYDLLEMGLFLPPGGFQKTFSLITPSTHVTKYQGDAEFRG